MQIQQKPKVNLKNYSASPCPQHRYRINNIKPLKYDLPSKTDETTKNLLIQMLAVIMDSSQVILYVSS